MMTNSKPLGIMKPLGGGDPIPLKKPELVVGRRATCDIQLDFENVSGKHCRLHHHNGVWYVRDLGSTNGTKVNGQAISTQHGLMPDDELGIAGHYYMIDYDPVTPSSVLDTNLMLEEGIAEAPARQRRSLMELAGLASGGLESSSPSQLETPPGPRRESFPSAPSPTDSTEPEIDEEPSPAPPPLAASDDDFFDMIRDDVEEE